MFWTALRTASQLRCQQRASGASPNGLQMLCKISQISCHMSQKVLALKCMRNFHSLNLFKLPALQQARPRLRDWIFAHSAHWRLGCNRPQAKHVFHVPSAATSWREIDLRAPPRRRGARTSMTAKAMKIRSCFEDAFLAFFMQWQSFRSRITPWSGR